MRRRSLRSRRSSRRDEPMFRPASGSRHSARGMRSPCSPSGAELDGAVPDRPVLLYQTTLGPAVTNTAGMAWFANAAMPVTIGVDGSIASGNQSTTALYLLRLTQTRDQRRRTLLETWAYS